MVAESRRTWVSLVCFTISLEIVPPFLSSFQTFRSSYLAALRKLKIPLNMVYTERALKTDICTVFRGREDFRVKDLWRLQDKVKQEDTTIS